MKIYAFYSSDPDDGIMAAGFTHEGMLPLVTGNSKMIPVMKGIAIKLGELTGKGVVLKTFTLESEETILEKKT